MAFLALVPPAAEAAGITVTANVSSSVVSLNETFTLSVAVEGAMNVPAPELGRITDQFTVYSSGTSSNMSIVNGRITSSKQWNYSLLPRETGSFVLGPVEVEVDGAVYSSRPIEIDVVEGQSSQAGGEMEVRESTGNRTAASDDIFVTMAVDKTEAYVDEQITLSFKYYRRVNVRSPRYESPDLTGFWTEDLPPPEEYVEIVAGKRYQVTEIRTALFGAAVGTATVGEAHLSYYGEGVPFTFFRTRGEKRTLRTKPITIEILPLPSAGRAQGFRGAVGRYTMEASVDVQEVQELKPVTLLVTLGGTGNVRTIPAPVPDDLPGFKMYESGSSTKITKKNGVVGGVRTFEYVCVPQWAGALTIPGVELAYFDPGRGRYDVVGTDDIVLKVTPRTTIDEQVTGTVGAVISRVGADIRYIREPAGSLRRVSRPLYLRPAFLLSQLLPLLSLVMVWVWKSRRRRLSQDSGLERFLKAPARVRRQLKIADAASAAGDHAGTCSSVARLTVDFIGDRLGVAARGMRSDQLRAALTEAGADAALADRVVSLLSACDLSRFAGSDASLTTAEIVEETGICIRGIERLRARRRR
jgi:hypothetical protein